jgi:FixJ family two-component response regulator
MGRIVEWWNAMSSRFARSLPSRRRPSEEARPASRILAIVPQGPIRPLVQAISRDAGWTLTLSDTSPGLVIGRSSDLPPIIIYDREISPLNWREVIVALTSQSPRPYVILLSPNADTNLWDELQRAGGSDIVRTPVSRDHLLGALKRAWLLWQSQQQVRLPSHRP